MQREHIAAWEACPGCAYPMVIAGKPENRCSECGDQHFGVCYLE